MTTITTMDGQVKVTIGETCIGFKHSVEQYGRLVRIEGTTLIISVFDGDTGDRYEVSESARRCWVE